MDRFWSHGTSTSRFEKADTIEKITFGETHLGKKIWIKSEDQRIVARPAKVQRKNMMVNGAVAILSVPTITAWKNALDASIKGLR